MKGKYIVKDPIYIEAVIDFRPYYVTEVSGSRVYLEEVNKELDENNDFDFPATHTPRKEHDKFIQKKSVVEVFDTYEDCLSCVLFARDQWKTWWDERRVMQSLIKVFLEDKASK